MRCPYLIAALLAGLVLSPAEPLTRCLADTKPPTAGKKPNRLLRTSSPYLLQHAYNPVDWYPWCEEAFERARKENKLVFLSIGYSSCHWCHVMEKESFAHESVARILNEHFVCIKVDREERPDIDRIYMTALGVMGQSGGWPLSMFLDATGRPIIGGTYWPREDREEDGKKFSGFKSILETMQELHKKEPKKLAEQAEKVARATEAALEGLTRGIALVDLDQKLLDATVEQLKEEFDPLHGGFGNAENKFRGPKFPMPVTLVFLQGQLARGADKELNVLVDTTLDRMARGGIYDHLGGGFHRYAVERTWTVPHFEKMLYDNGQLLEVYARAFVQNKKPLYRRVLRQTIDFVTREMTSPEGGFYAALDADSEGEEGRFYVWTPAELQATLRNKEDLKLVRLVYGADQGLNFESKYHILKLSKPLDRYAADLGMSEEQLETRLAGPRQLLFEARAKRPRPFLDTKILTGWNGQMIAGLARAGHALGDREAVRRAERAADFVLDKLRTKEGRLLRSYSAVPGEKPQARFNGYVEDYAFLVHGLLTLHDVTGNQRWLETAKELTDTMIRWFGDEKRGGFFYTSSDHEKLFARGKDQFDGAQPSGNSMAAANLVRLWQKTGEARYSKEAERTFRALSATLKASPSSLCLMADALGQWLHKK
jgi:uncharacterized protein YyaL (SSP411 family)